MEKALILDYDNSIVSLSNSLLKYYGISPYHSSLDILDRKLAKGYQNIIYMILDGMGMELIHRHLPKTSFIRSHISKKILSVFPPTTAAATTAFHSGLTPYESGWLGWMCYYKQYDEIIENFRNTAFYSGKKLEISAPMSEILNYETIYEKITKKNKEIEFHKVFPAFEKGGVNSFKEMCDRIISLSHRTANHKLFSAYWTEPDHSTHEYGTLSEEVKQILLDIDRNLERLYNDLSNALLIVSADHGAIDVEEVYLNQYPELCELLIRPPSLEARFVTFFVKEGKKNLFAECFNKLFSEDFKLFTKEEFLKSGILGFGNMHTQIPDFLGDFICISFGKRSLRYTTGEKQFNPLKADHAGMSDSEMYVPLIIMEKI